VVRQTPKPGSRETLLIAIAKARKWVKGIERGQTFVEIAAREGKAERLIRYLARLAFVSPRIITDYRRHRSSRDHRDDAHNWAFLFLGRGTADRRPRAPSTPPPAGRGDVLMPRRAAWRTKTWQLMPDSATPQILVSRLGFTSAEATAESTPNHPRHARDGYRRGQSRDRARAVVIRRRSAAALAVRFRAPSAPEPHHRPAAGRFVTFTIAYTRCDAAHGD
jgi:hypothetical protein